MAMAFLLTTGPLPAVFAQRDLQDIPDPDPELERKTFIVADGMEVNLYAADPLLAKPIQMNFDAQGRLWVASSEVYPQVKPGQKPTDKILVLEDEDGDGKAGNATVFADGLLIPTGVVPDHNGGCYVANSTELLHLADTNGDGKPDQRKVILSGFGTEDTHHLLHTLRWGPDGCLYMNQSIYIHSHVETPYGVKRLSGGGIWRFRPETMELDVLCHGFVNPWGHHFDRWGQSFVTDGAYGEGINYVFPGSVFVTAPGASRIVAGLNPGSPKHCGLEIVSGRHMPPDWDGNMITSDYRAHRVCRFVVTEDNSGYASRQETEVIKTQHVAFRPIDAKMGPDGAIYIADWYNPIIQHGEVDFRDERRDHTHGRIWRVSAKGRKPLQTAIPKDADGYQLLALLKEPEEWTRQNAKIMLKHRHAQGELVEVMLQRWLAGLRETDPNHEHHLLEGLWVCECIDNRDEGLGLIQQLAKSKDHRVRAAAIRVATHWRTRLHPEGQKIVRGFLQVAAIDQHPRVRLEGVRGLATVGTQDAAKDAANVLAKPMDRFLDFALWQTMRDLSPAWLPGVKEGKDVFGGDLERLTYALKAVNTPDVVPTLLSLIQEDKLPANRVDEVLSLIAQLGGGKELGAIYALIIDEKSKLPAARKAALLDSLVETSRLKKVLPAGDLAQLARLAEGADDRLIASVLRAGGAWKQASVEPMMLRAAVDSEAPLPLRLAAIDALAMLGGDADRATLTKIGSEEKTLGIRQRAIGAIATLDVKLAAQLTMKLLAAAPPGVDPAAAIAPLLANQEGPAAMSAALKDAKLSADTAKLVLRTVRASPQPSEELIASVQNAGGLEAAVWKLTPDLVAGLVADVKERGNPARGESIYRNAQLQCLKCHAIGGAGGVVGPDLVSIGASAQVDYLIESMITPSSKIKEGFHSKLVLDADGQQYTGVVVREDGQTVVLRSAEDKLVTIAKTNIEQIKDSTRSLMPDGAADALTRAELVDLVRFLSEIGKVGGQYTVGQKRVVRRWQSLVWTKEAQTLLNRTSYDSAASDSPALTWDSAYSTVAGELPLDPLPSFVVHQGQDPTTFVRAELDVSTAGKAKLLVSAAAVGNKVSLWVDGKPTPLAGRVAILELDKGRHTLTISVGTTAQVTFLTVELQDIAGSPAQVQIVGGK
ncbi:MAG: sorbosone dehydrogenase [Pirellulaceae bacterium]|nr:sorbosone dehydrogenase [Pirellulaceae bacterium]